MKSMASRPLVILPGGIYIRESDIRRFSLSRRAKARLQSVAMFLGFIALCVLASFDGWS